MALIIVQAIAVDQSIAVINQVEIQRCDPVAAIDIEKTGER